MSDALNNDKGLNGDGERNKRKGFFNLLVIFILIFIFNSFIFNKEGSVANQRLVESDPYKITLYSDFEDLLNSNSLNTVYMNENSENVFFTVKEGVEVKKEDYDTNNKKTLMKKNILNPLYKKSDNSILVHKTFNPKTEKFKEILLSKDVQVIDLPQESKLQSTFKMLWPILSMFFYIFLFKTFLFPSDSDKVDTNTKIPDVKFDQIAGNKEAKDEMQFLVKYLKNPELFNKMGASMPKGILFYGPPGTGKTLMAKAIAGEAGVPFYERSGTDFVDKYVGVGAQRIKSLFKLASKNQPCIIFIDEIDSIGGVRGANGIKEFDNILNQLLVEMDGFTANDGVIVIAATNRIDSLDSGLARPGRFDRHIAIELPDVSDRESLLKMYLEDKPFDDSIDIKQLAGLCYGFSGAAIKSFVNEAALIATQKDKEFITKEDLDDSFVKMAMGSHPKRVYGDDMNKTKLIAYHEAGHALITKLFTDDVFHKVTIVGTTSGVGGFTASTPKEENFTSRYDLYNRIRVAYGGRAAEYLLFDKDESKVTTGSSNDLKVISEILEYMVNEVGMNDSMLFKLTDNDKGNNDIVDYKTKLANQLYLEVVEFLDENRELLDIVSESLIEKETLSSSELDEIINSFDIINPKK